MTGRVEVPEPDVRKIVDTGSRQRRIDPQHVGEALGPEQAAFILPAEQGPFSLFAVREALVNAIQSPRGRPAIKGASRRQKIPLREDEWSQLCELAVSLRKAGVKTTAGQLASILLHMALQQLMLYERLKAEHEGRREQPLLRLAAELHRTGEVSVPVEVKS